MKYKILFHPQAAREVEKLDNRVKLLVFKQIKKLSLTPRLGHELGNKQGLDLSGYRKIYADKKKLRIIYKFADGTVFVQIIAVGKRESMEAYKNAAKRI
ncbi:MAG: type II toxin-antitoxin system RelE/ParE family toxin [Deltaproteobacteria bacterium]|nr:MAG: type II toxin-antitoxin system RelE/ParE family toxin [Deltaproteobacteria bacterium]